MGYSATVRFFGGPLNDEIRTVDRSPVLALMPTPAMRWDDQPSPTDIAPREVRYDLEKVAFGGEMYRVAVAAGFPRHRILDEMNAIHGLSNMRWLWGCSSP